jgi:hypothetical protein
MLDPTRAIRGCGLMGRLVRFAGVAVLAAAWALGGYWIVRQAYQGQPATDLRSLATKACARPATAAQRTDCVQLAAAVSADDSADLSRLALLLSLAGTVVAALGTVIVVRSLDHSRRAIEASTEANEIARSATEMQQRAWLSVGVESPTLSAVNDDLRVKASVKLFNHGSTPARNVSYYAMLSFSQPVADAHETIHQFETEQLNWTSGTIFPAIEQRYFFDSIAENTPQGPSPVYLIVVVAYRTAFTDTMRFSAFGWQLHNAADRRGLVDPAQPPSKTQITLLSIDLFPGLVT